MITKRVICCLLCAVMLCSCAAKQTENVSGEQSVTIQTFESIGTSEAPASTTSETLNTDLLTSPASTEPSTRVPPETSVTEPKTDRPATTASKGEDKPASSAASGDYVITPASAVMYATASVNVREEPDADSERVGHLDKGEKVNVTGLVSNGWVRIEFKDGEYFVNGSYLGESGGSETTKATEKTTAKTEEKKPAPTTDNTENLSEDPEPESESDYDISDAEGTMLVTETLNVRTEPDPSAEKVGQLHAGETVIVTGLVSNGWVRIRYENKNRFVSGEYLTVLSNAPQTPNKEIGGFVTGTNSYKTLNYGTQKAVWFAYLDIDSMLQNASESQFRSRIGTAFDNVVSIGCNTVYVHVRSFGDSYYTSAYYPFTAAYGGRLDSMPSYDPLEIMIDEAHDRGLSFHAWVNPMRINTAARIREMSQEYSIRQWFDSPSTNGTYIVYDSDSGYYWLSPAYEPVRKLICAGIAEIVVNYDVDAIHIDDYFYPTTSTSFDKAAFEASRTFNRDDWRRDVVGQLVKDIYSTVKSCNKSVLFGVSPQGNIENNRNQLYADVVTWCSRSGYLDYVVPQIYYGFGDKLAFDVAAAQWAGIVTGSGIDLVCGIAAYKVGTNSEWSSGSILKKQTEHISQMSDFDGVAYYRYGSLFGSASSSEKLMRSEIKPLAEAIASF